MRVRFEVRRLVQRCCPVRAILVQACSAHAGRSGAIVDQLRRVRKPTTPQGVVLLLHRRRIVPTSRGKRDRPHCSDCAARMVHFVRYVL